MNQFWKPYNLYLSHALTTGNFPLNGKKQMLSQFIKKWQTIENYGPIPLLLICGRTLERLINNKMIELFTENEIMFPTNQDSNQGTPASISYYTLLTIFTNHSMTVSKSEVSFLINHNHLVKSDTRIYPTNSDKIV